MHPVIDEVIKQAQLPGGESRMCRQQRRLVQKLIKKRDKQGLVDFVKEAVPFDVRSALGSGPLDLAVLEKIARPTRDQLRGRAIYLDLVTFVGLAILAAYVGSGTADDGVGDRLSTYEKEKRRADRGLVVKKTVDATSRHLDSALLQHATMNIRLIGFLAPGSSRSEAVLLEGLFADFFGTVCDEEHNHQSASMWQQHYDARPPSRKQPSYMPLNSTSPLAQGSGQEPGSLWSFNGGKENAQRLPPTIEGCAVYGCDANPRDSTTGRWERVQTPKKWAKPGSKRQKFQLFFQDVPEAKGLYVCKAHIWARKCLKRDESNTLAGLEKMRSHTRKRGQHDIENSVCYNSACGTTSSINSEGKQEWRSAATLFPNEPADKTAGVFFCGPCGKTLARPPLQLQGITFAQSSNFPLSAERRTAVAAARNARRCARPSCTTESRARSKAETLFPGEEGAVGKWVCNRHQIQVRSGRFGSWAEFSEGT